MCLLRSYQRRSITFVKFGSSFAPSRRDKGEDLEENWPEIFFFKLAERWEVGSGEEAGEGDADDGAGRRLEA